MISKFKFSYEIPETGHHGFYSTFVSAKFNGVLKLRLLREQGRVSTGASVKVRDSKGVLQFILVLQ